MKRSILLLFILTISLYSCKNEKSHDLPDGLYAQIETSKGDIILALDYKKTPVTVANFVTLAEGKNEFITDKNLKEKPFYDGLKFHRVIKDFMIQGGDPSGTGSGDTGYKFKDEITEDRFDKGGILAMANSGPATNSSQFFITHLETPWLDDKHTIFGHVIEDGMQVVNKIEQDDYINKVIIIRKGEAAKKFDAVKIFRNYFVEETKNRQKKLEQEAATLARNKEVFAKKAIKLSELKTTATKTPSGLKYIFTKKAGGKKPAKGTTIYIQYAGFLENGMLFDSCMEDVSKTFGKYDENRAAQGGYRPMEFQAGQKSGLIPGFLEGLEKLSFGDKATLFIPSHLAYGEAGAGNVIPPNTDIIFEIELLENTTH